MNKVVTLWKKDTGNYLSHRDGLTEEQIKFLHSLKEGDRIILWDQARRKQHENQPDMHLAKFLKKEDL